jgi:acyl-coenzyme A thioesterase PaaI-like protein
MMVPLAGNENHIGSMYAGALFTLAEMPGGAVFLTTFDASVFYPVVKEMNIRYLKPARSDVTIEIAMAADEAERIEKEAREKGKAEFILEGELIDRDGQVVARSHGVYQIRLIGR